MHPRIIGPFVALWLLLAAATPARAWNPPGHMTAAAIAYDQLAPAQRAWAVAILAAGHPDFAKWQQAAPKDVPGFDFGRYAFMRASTWPDDIRKTGSPYDHPPWHYVDFPARPPDFPSEEPAAGVENLLTAYAQCEKTLTDTAAPAMDRAASLSWLIHLTADIQQPLHGAALINADYPAPDGDRGGNLFFVNLAGNAINLHAYWDGLGGTMLDTHEIIARAADLAQKYPRAALPELTTGKDVRAWALESRQLAIDVVYRRGTLPGSKEALAVLPALPGDYASTARRLAERRLTLGGYRLADELTRLQR